MKTAVVKMGKIFDGRKTAAVFGIALLSGLTTHTFAGVLGPADGYTIFTLGDLSMKNVDVTGTAAVGGNANFNNYTVGTNTSATSLVVGGNLTNQFATLTGHAIVNGNVTWNDPSVNGAIISNGNVSFTGGGGSTTGATQHLGTFSAPSYFTHTQLTSPVSLPVDFSTAGTILTNLANSIATLPTNGSTVNTFNTITFTGSSPSTNVFTISQADLQNSVGFHFSVPTGSTTVVNVIGSGIATLPNTGFLGETDSMLLWNFSGFTGLTMSSFDGSILAPTADVTANSGGVNGQIIANSITGGINGSDEFHGVLFAGDPGLNGSGRAPEPASLSVIGIGAALLLRRRR